MLGPGYIAIVVAVVVVIVVTLALTVWDICIYPEWATLECNE